MADHTKHRNVLYSLVIILAVINIASFTILSFQISKLNSELNSKIDSTELELQTYSTELVEKYDSSYQENFREISDVLAEQQEDFAQEINLLKSSQEDFSGIVTEAVKSVVTVSAGNSAGSGFVVGENGYIVTNHHVIDGSEDDIKVLTYDRKTYSATLIGSDVVRDLSLLKINSDYPVLEIANLENIQVGKKVIAIGNPLGLSFSVTEGIISGLERTGPNGLKEYIQTDVSLNPGNSGGPLIDTTGKFVGMNNFKIGGAESLGFALQGKTIKSSVNLVANETIIQ